MKCDYHSAHLDFKLPANKCPRLSLGQRTGGKTTSGQSSCRQMCVQGGGGGGKSIGQVERSPFCFSEQYLYMQDKCVTHCEAASIDFGIDEPKPTVFLKTIRMCSTPQMEKTASKNKARGDNISHYV